MDKIEIKTEYIKLDSLLKYAGLSATGADAKVYIKQGNVMVNGEVEKRRGRKIYKGDIVKTKSGEIYVC